LGPPGENKATGEDRPPGSSRAAGADGLFGHNWESIRQNGEGKEESGPGAHSWTCFVEGKKIISLLLHEIT
jgi:hypothetical protein